MAAVLEVKGMEKAEEAAQSPSAQEVFFQMLTGYWVSKAIYVAARLGVADQLKEEPRTVEELAAETGAHAPTLRRLLRALAGVGIFREEPDGRYSQTPLSELITTGPGSVRSLILHLMERPSWSAWGELHGSVMTGQTGFRLAHGVDVFPYYAEHPESAEPFNQAMVEFSAATGVAVVEAYDFSGFRKVVDVGGGHGGFLAQILKANPQVRGVVFDAQQVVEGAPAVLRAHDLTDERFEVAGGDFFESVPEGGDAYVLKHIVHDWDDERSVAILRNVRRAMPDGGRLLIIETLVPEGEGPAFPKLMDLHMLIMTGGRERTAKEFRDLLARAGFEMTRVVETKSQVCVVEATKKVSSEQ